MPLRHKKNRLRRFAASRSRPLPKRSTFSVAPTGKGTSRFVMTAVFLLGSLIVLNMPKVGSRLRVDDIAKRDYRARTAFQAPDEEATRREREEAAGRAMRVFREDTDALVRLPREVDAFLNNVSQVRQTDSLASMARVKWGLSRAKLDALRDTLDTKWITPGIDALDNAVQEAVRNGIVAASLHQAEFASERYEIEVRPFDNSRKPERRSIVRTIAHPSGLRRFYRESLLLWFRDKPDGFQETMLDMLVHATSPTLKLDDAATEESIMAARKEVRTRYRTIAKGSIIVGVGDRVTRRAIEEIKLEKKAFAAMGTIARDQEGEGERLRRRALNAVGLTAVFFLGLTLLAVYGFVFAADAMLSNTRVFGVYTVIFITVAALRLLEIFGASYCWAPVILASMVLVVATGPIMAFGVTGFLAVIAGSATEGGLGLSVPLLVGGIVGILGLIHVRRRTDPFEAGVLAGVACAVSVWAFHLNLLPSDVATPLAWPWFDSLAAMGGGLGAGVLLSVGLPYVERFFDVATDLRLLEWTDQNQPLLRKLALEAPGTYHHSTVVSNMAEAAAKEIGANALLARAGAYLHDVGKLNRPEYFIENGMGRPSRHDGLKPMMSTLILTAHTQDGAELAKAYGVPAPLRWIIQEHHGTTTAQFFYRKACENNGGDDSPQEAMFRYRGPKPRRPESAIVMLADAVESASRTLDNASPSRIEQLVRSIVEARIDDGQLDESRLNITDIRRVEASLVRSLTAVSHPRIRYPGL